MRFSARETDVMSALGTALGLGTCLKKYPTFHAGLPASASNNLATGISMSGKALKAEVSVTHAASCWEATKRELTLASFASYATSAPEGPLKHAYIVSTCLALSAAFTVLTNDPVAVSADEVGCVTWGRQARDGKACARRATRRKRCATHINFQRQPHSSGVRERMPSERLRRRGVLLRRLTVDIGFVENHRARLYVHASTAIAPTSGASQGVAYITRDEVNAHTIPQNQGLSAHDTTGGKVPIAEEHGSWVSQGQQASIVWFSLRLLTEAWQDSAVIYILILGFSQRFFRRHGRRYVESNVPVGKAARNARDRGPDDEEAAALNQGKLAGARMLTTAPRPFAKQEVAVVAPLQCVELHPCKNAMTNSALGAGYRQYQHRQRVFDATFSHFGEKVTRWVDQPVDHRVIRVRQPTPS